MSNQALQAGTKPLDTEQGARGREREVFGILFTTQGPTGAGTLRLRRLSRTVQIDGQDWVRGLPSWQGHDVTVCLRTAKDVLQPPSPSCTLKTAKSRTTAEVQHESA